MTFTQRDRPVKTLAPFDSESEAESTAIDVKGNRIFLSNLLSTPPVDRRSVA
jgi:hypothetical protein